MVIVIIIIILIIVAVIGVKIFKAVMKKKAEQLIAQTYEQTLADAKIAYDEALNGKDKRDALVKGRRYYSVLRGGIAALAYDFSDCLTAEDEARINTDLNSMNV